MQRIVLLIYHGTSHFNACFKLAKILQQQYEVTIAGYAYFRNHVEHQGLKFYSLKTVPFGLGFEKWVNKIDKKKNLYWHTIADRWRDKLYHLREMDLQNLIKDLNPEYLLIDAWQSTDFIVIYTQLLRGNINTAFLQFMPPTEIVPKMPPINSLALPGDLEGIHQGHMRLRSDQRKQKFIQKLKFLGMDNRKIISRRLIRNEISTKFVSPYNYIFSPHFKNVNQYIVIPQEFDFLSTPHNPDHYYLGFLPDDERIEHADDEYLQASQAIFRSIEKENKILIYCSFGTVQHEEMKPIITFIKRLSLLVNQLDCIVVVSVNNKTLTSLSNHKNFFVFNRVKQLEVLSKANVFITHGGLNSIKESIHACVPMLVYPLSLTSDTKGNSSRVVYHKLGLRGDLLKDSMADLKEKIQELLHNPVYKNNLAAFKKLDDQYDKKKDLSIAERSSTSK